jgi:hypothetical protein
VSQEVPALPVACGPANQDVVLGHELTSSEKWKSSPGVITRFVPQGVLSERVIEPVSRIGESQKKKTALLLSLKLHLKYLRSHEESERVQTACMTYLQAGITILIQTGRDMVAEMRDLARQLGGSLEVPRLPWKYAWIPPSFGWPAAKRAKFDLFRTGAEGIGG